MNLIMINPANSLNFCAGRCFPSGSHLPLHQEAPSQEEPFVFLWDEKSGGTAFMQWLKYSARETWRPGGQRICISDFCTDQDLDALPIIEFRAKPFFFCFLEFPKKWEKGRVYDWKLMKLVTRNWSCSNWEPSSWEFAAALMAPGRASRSGGLESWSRPSCRCFASRVGPVLAMGNRINHRKTWKNHSLFTR